MNTRITPIKHKVRVLSKPKQAKVTQQLKAIGLKPEWFIPILVTPMVHDGKPFLVNIFESQHRIMYEVLTDLIKNWKVFPQTIRVHRMPGRILTRFTPPYYLTTINFDTGLRERVYVQPNGGKPYPVVLDGVTRFLFDSECDEETSKILMDQQVSTIYDWV